MNRRAFLATSLASLLPGCNRNTATSNPVDDAARLIQAQVDADKLESAVLQVDQGTYSDSRAFGQAASPEAVFLIASITKPMTAAGLMLLSDRGELALSDPVQKFIPEFKDGDRPAVTIEDLLAHTSGLPDQLPNNHDLRRAHAPLSDFVKAAIKTPLLFKPGTRYSYQSMGILLAAEIAQRITGATIHDFLRDEIFLPLGMKDSTLGLGDRAIADTVRCQTESAAPESGSGAENAKDWNWNSPYWRNFGAPWGGAHAPAADISRFLHSFLRPGSGPAVLRPETARSMIANRTAAIPGAAARGIGFALGPDYFGKSCSPATFGHGGATGTLAWSDPVTGLTVTILSSLPKTLSGPLFLHPVSDLLSKRASP